MATGKKIKSNNKPPRSRKTDRQSESTPSAGAAIDPASSPGVGQGEDRIAEFLALSAREMADHIFGKPEVWLNHPNPQFGGRTPNDLIESGEEDRVRNILAAATLGMF